MTELSTTYLLRCTVAGCKGERLVSQDFSVAWVVGQFIPMDPTDPGAYRCPRCKRHGMRVETAPEPSEQPPPKGFTKVPTE